MRSTNSLYSSAPRTHLRIDGVSRSFAGRRVLTDVSFSVSAGERIGLIGENGSGKSTLLRIIAGLSDPDRGAVRTEAPGGVVPRIGLLHQEPPFAPTSTVSEALEAAVRPAREAAAAVDRAAAAVASAPEDPATADVYSRALDSAERLGVWEIDARIGTMLDGVGLADLPRDRRSGDLSGGQRARLSLAWVLLNGPDVLLMDEPTNHLDDQAVDHLRRVLESWRGPVLFASHDRAFLDEAATSLLDLDPTPKPFSVTEDLLQDGTGTGIGISRFTGGYGDYLAARTDARLRWSLQYRDEQNELARLRAAIGGSQQVGHVEWKPRTESKIAKKFYADRNARVVSRRVNDARSRLAELEERQIRKPPNELRFAGFAATIAPGAASVGSNASGSPVAVLKVSGLAVTGRLSPVDLEVAEGERWLITGPNGSGKSTLLHALAGGLVPDLGRVEIGNDARIGLLTQEVALPDPHRRGSGRSVREVYSEAVGTARAEEVPLSTFGLIAGRDEHRPADQLSVGQQRRLELAILLVDPPPVLLLDEPTNHLSLTLIEELETAILDYPGTVLIASHDRRLRTRWAGRSLALAPAM